MKPESCEQIVPTNGLISAIIDLHVILPFYAPAIQRMVERALSVTPVCPFPCTSGVSNLR